ncbi:MAG TPA: DUF4142 domain-containing protein [Xanthobacteraceae bacterium]|nr:DUF4142 domain-containing protein [Xanthobacteraceae bacterium]
MRSYLVLAAGLLLAPSAFAQSADVPPSSGARQFLDFAAHANQSEIQAGLAAEKKAQAPAVKAFARLMVVDHMALESQLAAAAAQVNVQLPNGPSDTAKQQMSQLQTKNGSQFDDSFLASEIKDHQEAIQKFRDEKSIAHNPTIIAVALGGLPILEQHLELAQMIEQALKTHHEPGQQPAPTVGSGGVQR